MIAEETRAFILGEVHGFLWPEEGERLAELAEQVPANLEIVELGSHQGLSACWLAAGSRAGAGAHITCIDIWCDEERADPAWAFHAFQANIAWGRWTDLVSPIRSDTLAAAKGWDRPIGLLFIDASHDYGSVARDFLAWSPHVITGGLVLFHDETDQFPGVARAIRWHVPKSWDDLGVMGRQNMHTFRKR